MYSGGIVRVMFAICAVADVDVVAVAPAVVARVEGKFIIQAHALL